MAGHSRSKNGVASLAYVPAIHVLAGRRKKERGSPGLRRAEGATAPQADKPGDDAWGAVTTHNDVMTHGDDAVPRSLIARSASDEAMQLFASLPCLAR